MTETKEQYGGAGIQFLKRENIADERGWLCEGVRESGQGHIAQVYYTTVLPGEVKGWHLHRHKTDRLFCVHGAARIVWGEAVGDSNKIWFNWVKDKVIGPLSPGVIIIDPGLWHSFAAVGPGHCVIVNAPDREYDPADPDQEELDLSVIPFDWGRG